MIDQLFREAKANAKTLQRANSVPSDKLEQRSRLPRLMSHEPKLETEEFQNIKKSGRFQIIRKQDQPKPSTTVKKSPDENSSELVV
ncbi:hypothetical protein EB796_021115 [Bugula neritina]|uniref:Uncharacterized protein n=1 Tax=Bugula neritina TaxID=10212 RepID=A0A7J7J4J4_BUGNE|nr:hypothetical protein EB796_021115 [Bugula neritina]